MKMSDKLFGLSCRVKLERLSQEALCATVRDLHHTTN